METNERHPCPTCGAGVIVEGNTTIPYEPIECEYYEAFDEGYKAAVRDTIEHIENNYADYTWAKHLIDVLRRMA